MFDQIAFEPLIMTPVMLVSIVTGSTLALIGISWARPHFLGRTKEQYSQTQWRLAAVSAVVLLAIAGLMIFHEKVWTTMSIPVAVLTYAVVTFFDWRRYKRQNTEV